MPTDQNRECFAADQLVEHSTEIELRATLDREAVHRVIFDELCRGRFEEASRRTVSEIVARLAADGCEGVVLGCTELELLLTEPTVADVPLFATTRLHCEAAVRAALQQPPA